MVPVYTYNSRLQMTDSWTTVGNDPNHYLSYLSPNWGATNNNGNLRRVLEGYGSSVPLISVGWLVQSYGYDTANRLVSVNDTGYTRSFGYNAWGNMWISGYTGIAPVGNPPTMSTGFNTNNQVTTGGAAYDAAGNQTVMNGDTVAYDAESRQSSITTAAQAVETYLYDGDGRRVKKVGPSVSTAYVYDALGQLAAEYSTATTTPVCTTCYLIWDNLGSTRLVTDQKAAIIARHDYLPFGEEIAGGTAARSNQWGSATDVTQKFTGQERDYENTPSLDYFGARYYGSNLGRFTSPDNGVDQNAEDPQSWNLYSYVRNNPLSNVDPDGRTCSHSKDAQGRDVITNTDGKGCDELYDNNVYAFGGNAGLAVLASVGEKTTNWREWVDVTRHGVEGAMYAEGVKDLAEGALTLADWLKGARDARKLANLSGLLRDALKGKGNFGLGTGTAEDAEELGKAWVGEGATTASDGKTLVSADKLRQYRPPSYKPNLGKTQTNFEGRWEPGGRWQTNGHLDIK